MRKYLLLPLLIILLAPVVNAFTFEKDYFIILDDAKLAWQENDSKLDKNFDLIEAKVFNNDLCDKYQLVTSEGKLVVKAPFTTWGTNQESIIQFSYKGNFYLNLYKCQKINIFNFNFKSDEINNSEDISRFAAYKSEYVFFDDYPISDLFNLKLKQYIDDYKPTKFDRNSQLFEFLNIDKTDFSYSDAFCRNVGYYLINEFYPAIFSDNYNEKLCNMGAYSLLKNHFLYLNEHQGFFISDYRYDENYNFRAALEVLLVRKLAEKAIYMKSYDTYQTKNFFKSALLVLTRPFDKSELYDIQSKNINMQITELIDMLRYVDNNLRVKEYGDLAITRIDRKNEQLAWYSIIIGLIGGISLTAFLKRIRIGKWYIRIKTF